MTYLCRFPTLAQDWIKISAKSPEQAAEKFYQEWHHLLLGDSSKGRVDVLCEGMPEEETRRFLVYVETELRYRVVGV